MSLDLGRSWGRLARWGAALAVAGLAACGGGGGGGASGDGTLRVALTDAPSCGYDHVYVTVGTGVGMGIVSGGHPVSGRMHPEAGHVRVRRMPGDGFTGVCPFHGDCLEGLVSGPAIAARAGRPAQELDAHDPAWTFVADALAESFVGLFLTLACGRIVVGGGVGMGQQHLLPMVQQRVVAKLAGYLPFVDAAQVANRIVHAQLGDQAGPLGTLALAQTVLPAR